MKVKLLKKLRKKYSWYFNKNRFPILINHVQKSVIVYDLEYLMSRSKYNVEDLKVKITISHQEWALRWLKEDILTEYGYKLSKSFYKQAIKNYNRKK